MGKVCLQMRSVLWKGLSGNVCLGLLVLVKHSSGLAWILSKRFAPILLLFEIQGLLVPVLIQIELMLLKPCTECGDAAGTGTELSSRPTPACVNIPRMGVTNCAGVAHCCDCRTQPAKDDVW